MGVPPPSPEVDAADERHLVIDDHDLFVVRGADRVLSVELEMQPVVGVAAHLLSRPGLTLEDVDHRPVPTQDVDFEFGIVRRAFLTESPRESARRRHPFENVAAGYRCRPPTRE